MSCQRCHLFFGDPICSICKTLLRIGDLTKGLQVFHEREALHALRECAGALGDLVDQDRLSALVAAQSGLPSSSAPGTAIPDEPAGPDPGKTKEDVKGAEEKPKDKEKQKAKDKKKKGKSKDKAAKKEKQSKGSKEAEEKEDDKETGERVEPEVTPSTAAIAPGGDRTGSRPVSDREVEERPEEHGLARIPVRGSAGRHFNDGARIRENSGARRPPEPDHSPPGHRGGHRGATREERPRSRREEEGPRWRGYKHFLRGRDHWPGLKRRRK